jgi:SAM-dependent methyltransferase
MAALPYRDILYPLNVFMHILTHEEGSVAALHYGFFERDGELMRDAQKRATEMLLARLPPPPARLLDAGCGLGTTLARLLALGYDAEGITPDAQQIAMMAVHLPVRCSRFEDLASSRYDAILFQESSQYIGSNALFEKAREMTSHVIVFDEFAMQSAPLHSYDDFLRAASVNGFEVVEDLDVSEMAAPSIDYFQIRFERFRESLVAGVGVTNEQIDALIKGGVENRVRFASGAYAYRVMQFRR